MAKIRDTDGTGQGSRLARAIGRLAGVAPEPAPGALARVLAEIDETVLPRRIEIRSENRLLATLWAANRRLYDLQDAAGDMAGPEGFSDPKQAARVFSDRLADLLSEVSTIRLLPRRAAFETGSDRIGCSAQNLARASGLCFDGAPPEIDLAAFLDALRPRALAWLRPAAAPGAGGEGGEGGEASLIEGLRAFARANLGNDGGRIGSAEPSCTLYPLPRGRLLVAAGSREAHVLAVLPESEQDQIIAAWRKRL